jgi:hypothetical protein
MTRLAFLLLAACASKPAPVTTPTTTETSAPVTKARIEIPPWTGPPRLPRAVLDIHATLPPIISGGWQGSPIERDPPPPMPAGWHGVALEYYRGPNADKPWSLPYKDYQVNNQDRARVMRTYLVWNSTTKEGIVVNPTASDAAFVVETAKAQAGIRWLYVIDSFTEAQNSPRLSGPDWVTWSEGLSRAPSYGLVSSVKTWRETREVIDAAGVATALGAAAVVKPFAAPQTTKAGKLLVFRKHMDFPHGQMLEVEWGPFVFTGDFGD